MRWDARFLFGSSFDDADSNPTTPLLDINMLFSECLYVQTMGLSNASDLHQPRL
jgi:hypothetical protein